MKNIEDIMENFMEDYKENPEGWGFWTNRSDDFYNIYIIHDDKGYFLKVDSIYNNNPLGLGTEISVERDQLEKKLPDFGFRRFEEDELKNFFESLSRSEDQEKKKKLVQRQMRKKPTLPQNVDEKEYVMMGPFNQGKPFQYPLEEQEKIDKKLRKKLKKKFRKKYPMYR
ncbi:MAG: hypothetical protein V5A66_04730 [Candidatus Thermoplasmatota archaeon]